MVKIKEKIDREGFAIINDVFTTEEVDEILNSLSLVDTSNPSFRISSDLFAIRQFLKEIPAIKNLVFTPKLNSIISSTFGNDFFVVKSIYFDKPAKSNWFVAYHQDLTISVKDKIDLEGYGPWTRKHNQFAVQPPVNVLQHNFTIRIHFDDTDENNGALKVVPGSHQKGIYRPETIDWTKEEETICKVNEGGIMIMRPLLLHASNRTTNNCKRRVLHIEFSNFSLPDSLQWSEKEFLLAS